MDFKIDELIEEVQNIAIIERVDLFKPEVVPNIDQLIDEVQKKRLESIKASKAKYYEKNREKLLENYRRNSKLYHEKKKNDPEYKEKQANKIKKYYETHKDEIEYKERNKENVLKYYHKKKLNESIEILEKIGFEKLAEILIINKKMKLIKSYITE
jgi:hypothetical protein